MTNQDIERVRVLEQEYGYEKADYPVTVSVDGNPFKVMDSDLRKMFDLFAPVNNWKNPIHRSVGNAEVIEVLPAGLESAPSIRSYIASAISYFVGGETKVQSDIYGYVTVRSAGYYNNIGA